MRNTIKLTKAKNFRFSKSGLNKNEREDLDDSRLMLIEMENIHPEMTDEYLTAYYSPEEDEIYFVLAPGSSSDPKAELI
jgi:hypothetical protein